MTGKPRATLSIQPEYAKAYHFESKVDVDCRPARRAVAAPLDDAWTVGERDPKKKRRARKASGESKNFATLGIYLIRSQSCTSKSRKCPAV